METRFIHRNYFIFLVKLLKEDSVLVLELLDGLVMNHSWCIFIIEDAIEILSVNLLIVAALVISRLA